MKDPDCDNQSKAGLQATFQGIKGFEVQTDLDRKLILGFWKNKEKDQVELPQALRAHMSAHIPGDASKTSTEQKMLRVDDLSVSIDH